MNSLNLLFFVLFSFFVDARGGSKCLTCPSCMVCDPLIGCVYDNFTHCLDNKINGYCINGYCNTTIGRMSLKKPPVCKSYKIVNMTLASGGTKLSARLINDINGLSCTQVGAIMESACINGVCTPYTLGIDKVGQPTGCQGLPDGFMCDTNGVFTDGEKCLSQKCVMPSNAPSFCKLV